MWKHMGTGIGLSKSFIQRVSSTTTTTCVSVVKALRKHGEVIVLKHMGRAPPKSFIQTFSTTTT